MRPQVELSVLMSSQSRAPPATAQLVMLHGGKALKSCNINFAWTLFEKGREEMRLPAGPEGFRDMELDQISGTGGSSVFYSSSNSTSGSFLDGFLMTQVRVGGHVPALTVRAARGVEEHRLILAYYFAFFGPKRRHNQLFPPKCRQGVGRCREGVAKVSRRCRASAGWKKAQNDNFCTGIFDTA